MLRTRIITGVALALALFGLVWFAPHVWMRILVFSCAVLGANELARMFFTEKFSQTLCVLSVAVAAGLQLWFPDHATMHFILIACFLFAMIYMWRLRSFEHFATQIGLQLFAVIYLGLAWPLFAKLHALPQVGPAALLVTIAGVALSDTGAFVAGKLFGKRKCAPSISPNKTWAGVVGGVFGSAIGVFLIGTFAWPELRPSIALGLVVVIAVIAPIGDLIESALKRGAGIKDSGAILPGHGGILDRIDAYIVTAPAVFAYLSMVTV